MWSHLGAPLDNVANFTVYSSLPSELLTLYENTITNFDSSQLYVTFNTTILNSWIKRHPEKELQFTRKIRYPIYLKAILLSQYMIKGETIKFVHIDFNYSSDVLNVTKVIFCLITK